MCGILGVLNLEDRPPVNIETLHQMLAMIRYRGPDGFGVYRDADVALGSARLSIIDLADGDQPIGNEDGTLWIVFNGEVFNYVELRPALEARGHHFSTHSDTEVILHLYEDYGPDCLNYLNGQFAIAIWDTQKRSLFLARDRLGVRPLFYTLHDGRLLFGSEVKTILAYPGVQAEIDPEALAQVFTFWSTLKERTVFRDIHDIPPGHYLYARDGRFDVQPYWSLDFEEPQRPRPAEEYLAELEELLVDATQIRLRADVPVGAYLSGGLDSSTITAIARKYTNNSLDTFSIAFADNPQFDESRFQQEMAAHLGTQHQVVHCTQADIGRVFPEVTWHTEIPVLRTAPAPMLLLSGLVHQHNLKVVLTGEGADEFLAGYDIFKEMKIRRFWARNPGSQIRPLLLRRLYPDIAGLGGLNQSFLSAFFGRNASHTDSPVYSHMIRWANTTRTQRFMAQSMRDGGFARPQTDAAYAEMVALPKAFNTWSPLAQAQYLESAIFLPQYLLSSQGDRMAMANSVEGRYPFLDYRVVTFCNHLPSDMKMSGLMEKWLLKQLGRKLLPDNIWQRPKRPYRAPIHHSFFGPATPDYVHELLSDTALHDSQYFNPVAVAQLVKKVEAAGSALSEMEEMALVGILSTQLVHHQFIKSFRLASFSSQDRMKIVDRVTVNNTADVGVYKNERAESASADKTL
jgi:asparagine synthase (glutamine-hydrolysing)